MTKQKVVIGLSGGVDSSVAAALLLLQGYEVEGVYLECYNEPGCRTDQDKADALKVAIQLGIPFQVLDFRREYKEKVIEYFYREYERGRTPNPDVVCNREIKFGIFYTYAIAQGYNYVATGHYCRILKTKDGSFFLQRGRDESKDQSYFLWQIPRDHLPHILFPIGDMLKSEVREKARQLGLPTANKPDSMGICFIGEVDVHQLLKERLGENPGSVVMLTEIAKVPNSGPESSEPRQELDLPVIGTHKGLWFYTIGERGGFTIDKVKLKELGMHPEKMGPLYVIGKDKERNQLMVGSREETMKREFRIDRSLDFGQDDAKLWVRIRNLGELHAMTQLRGNTVKLSSSVFGVAEGQSAVFYDENNVLVDGGIIV